MPDAQLLLKISTLFMIPKLTPPVQPHRLLDKVQNQNCSWSKECSTLNTKAALLSVL